MTAIEQQYFHINSHASNSPYPLMCIGDEIDIGENENPFFHFYEEQLTFPVTNKSNGIRSKVPAIQFLRKVNDGSISCKELPTIAFDTANHFLMLARELVWENVRLSEFPKSPSRQRCLFLIESLDDVSRWLKLLGLNPDQYSVVTVRATGTVLRVDSQNLAEESEPLTTWFEKAHLYWSGTISTSPLIEVLFQGHIVVDSIVEAKSLN